jgi:hypothetical protein
MRLKTQRRAVYVAMGLTVLALVGGYSLASLTLGSTSTSTQQGSSTVTVSGVTGLSMNATNLTMTGAQVTNTTDCQETTGCSVTSTGATVCAGSTHVGVPWCSSGDFLEQVVLNTTPNHPFSGTVAVTLFVTAAGTSYQGVTFYFTDATGNAREPITIDFDVGTPTSGPAAVSDLTVIATASG